MERRQSEHNEWVWLHYVSKYRLQMVNVDTGARSCAGMRATTSPMTGSRVSRPVPSSRRCSCDWASVCGDGNFAGRPWVCATITAASYNDALFWRTEHVIAFSERALNNIRLDTRARKLADIRWRIAANDPSMHIAAARQRDGSHSTKEPHMLTSHSGTSRCEATPADWSPFPRPADLQTTLASNGWRASSG